MRHPSTRRPPARPTPRQAGLACVACGVRNPTTHRFCGQCGAALRGTRPVPRVEPSERRHLTVMFCDLVDSTPLGERLDPEDLLELTRLYQHTCGGVIARYGGHVARYVGDGLLVYFGYPRAHEDDAVRAVNAGLGIVEELGRVNEEIASRFDVRLRVRIGVHSGLIVLSGLGADTPHGEQALGHTMNVAARVQGLATPDTVIVTAATLGLTGGAFVTRALGQRTLKGVRAPVHIHAVLERASGQRRGDVVDERTPLVGRDRELRLLRETWERATAGNGQVVVVSGEAGIGKSRLLRALRESLAADAPPWREGRASPFAREGTLNPVLQLLRDRAGLDEDAPPESLPTALAAELTRTGLDAAEVVPLLIPLLGIPSAAPFTPSTLSPEAQRRRLLERLTDWLLAGRDPIVVVFEDVHWFDESTIELLALLVERVRHAPVLLLVSVRTGFALPWDAPHVTQVALDRLGPAETERLVRATAVDRLLADELVAAIVRRTDGIPLFAEELTRALADHPIHPDGPGGAAAIPSTLQELLAARLDRLGSAKEIAQLGATLGREFSYDLLAAVALHDHVTLRDELARLVTAELLEQHARPPRSRYAFRHALIQEAAYQSVPKGRRQRYHEQVARVLEQRFPTVTSARPELVAHHYTCGGLNEPAIGYWERATRQAMVRSAHPEAVRHAREALLLLTTMPRTAERGAQELALRCMSGFAYTGFKGYGAPEVAEALGEARRLGEQLGDTPQLVPVLFGLHAYYLVRADRSGATRLAEQLVHLTRDAGDPALRFMGAGAAGTTCFWEGHHARAETLLRDVRALYDPARHRALAVAQGQEPGAAVTMYLALVRWFRGFPDEALGLMREALAIARATPHPQTLTMVTNFAADLRYLRGERALHRTLVERTLALAAEHSFPLWHAGATSSLGWTKVEAGDAEGGLEDIRNSLDTTLATGALVNRPFILGKLAAAHLRAGNADAGLEAVREGIALAGINLDQFWCAELHRLEGELLLLRSGRHADAAASSFARALEVAREQDALSLELRAARSQALLWSRQRRRREARALLAGVYARFTEGLGTRDLRMARRTLASMS